MAIKIQGSTIIDDGRNIINAGISTLGGISIATGIVTAAAGTGIVTYYGDGQYLINIPSQGNLDGGGPSTNYGGLDTINGGTV